jgi:3-deoxy-manno-octulosonate cytidylyltransferase (CMP-KDO synthetase)
MPPERPTIIAVIPARYASTRFPGKPLALIKGRPMIQWVYERTKASSLIGRVIVATDDERILRTVKEFGGDAVMTSTDHATGTDRTAEVARTITCDIVVNVQGDEPLMQPAMIDEAIRPLVGDPTIPMGTLAKLITDQREVVDPNVVKVVFDDEGFVLYFSRAPIPWNRDRWAGAVLLGDLPFDGNHYKHIGLYVYRRDFLLAFASMPQSRLETVEKLEQLRTLERGHRIKVVVTEHESFGVDIPDDLGKILQHLP